MNTFLKIFSVIKAVAWLALCILSIYNLTNLNNVLFNEGLDYIFAYGFYKTTILFSVMGIIDSFILFVSLKLRDKNKTLTTGILLITALLLNIFLLLFILLLYLVNKAWVRIFFIAWILCLMIYIVALFRKKLHSESI